MKTTDGNDWGILKEHFGYSEEDMAAFMADPRNIEVLRRARELLSKTFVAEVVHSHGCNSQHKVGDFFYLDGAGNLISDLCPKKMCIQAVSALKQLVFAAQELMYADVDPNRMLFKRCGCGDVGLECRGWGRVVLEIRTHEKRDARE